MSGPFDRQFARHTAQGIDLVLAAMTRPPYRSEAEHAHHEGLTIPADDEQLQRDPRDDEPSEMRGAHGRYLSNEQADLVADEARDREIESRL